jgi:hypothetical protein
MLAMLTGRGEGRKESDPAYRTTKNFAGIFAGILKILFILI